MAQSLRPRLTSEFAPRRGARAARLLVLVSAMVSGFAAASEGADSWKFDAALYGWLPNINIELPSGQKSKITQSDILDNLSMAFMGRGQVRKGRWSLATDLNYFKLSHNGDEPLRDSPLALRKVELQAAIVKPTIGYRFFESSDNWAEVYAGARYLWLEATLGLKTLPPAPPAQRQEAKSDTRWDALVGIRGAHALSPRWYVRYLADVGGGESDSVVDLFAGVGYRFEKLSVIAAWRYLDYDFGDDFPLNSMDVNGPLVGVEFSF